jgi:hypothetical protein
MQASALLALQEKYRHFRSATPSENPSGFFDTHAVGPILRSFFFTSLLWVFLALTIYTVYSFIVSAN